MPQTECYESAIWNPSTCEWDIVQDGDPSCAGGSIDGCETAFARSRDENVRTCFDDVPNFSSPRWGWTNELPSANGTYDLDLYAAAGQCNISNGALIGNVQVTYNNGSVDVSVSTFNGYHMTEAQLYVGADPIPTNPNNGNQTVAPGQYPYQDGVSGDFDNYTFQNISVGMSDSFYVILHAEVCPDDSSNKVQPQIPLGIVAYPVKFKEDLTLAVQSPTDMQADINIYDISGKRIKSFGNFNLQEGDNTIPLYVGDVPGGVYIIRLNSFYAAGMIKVVGE